MKENKTYPITNIFVVLVMICTVAPLVYWGKDSILTVHDNLDQVIPWIKMLKDNGLLLSLDSPMPILGGMSTAYTIHNSFATHFCVFWSSTRKRLTSACCYCSCCRFCRTSAERVFSYRF